MHGGTTTARRNDVAAGLEGARHASTTEHILKGWEYGDFLKANPLAVDALTVPSQ